MIGWCWFLGTMVPVIGLKQVSHADRYLYIPMLGLAFVFPVLFEMLGSLGTWIKNIVTGVSLAVLSVAMIMATQIQVSYWQDGVTLCRHSLDVSGYSFIPALSLCLTYNRTERYDEFLTFIDRPIALEKNLFNKAMLVTMKANVLYNDGKYQAAVETAQSAIEWGFTNKTKYAILALSSYKLGHPEIAAQYLAKAKAAPEPSSGTSLLSLPLTQNLDWLELRLKEKPLRRDSKSE